MSNTNPLRDPGAWDWILISGKPLPGIPTIEGAGAPQKWDKRRGYGTSGAYLVYMGADLSSFTINVLMWDPDQIDYYNEQIVPELLKGMTGKTALDFYAPAASEPPCSIKQIVIDDPGEMTIDDDGFAHVAIKVTKYKRPKPAAFKPLPDSKDPKPTDALQGRVSDLNKQFNSTADAVAAQTNKLLS